MRALVLVANLAVLYVYIALGDACYVKSDGAVWRSYGSGSAVHGFCPRAHYSGEPVTLYGYGTRFQYGSSLTIGAKYYLTTGTPGGIDTVTPLSDNHDNVAISVSATDIVVLVPRFN